MKNIFNLMSGKKKIMKSILLLILLTGLMAGCSGDFLSMALEEEPPNTFYLTNAAPQANTIIMVYFTYSLDYETALNAANYNISGLEITAVNAGTTNNTVILTTVSMEETEYTLEVSGVRNSDLIEINPEHSSIDFTGLQTLIAEFISPPPKFTNELNFNVYVGGDYADAANYRWKLVRDPNGTIGVPEIIQDWSDIIPIADPIALNLDSGEVDYRLSAIVEDVQGIWQGVAAPTEYDFTLDSTAPDALFFSNLPDDPTNLTNTDILVVDRICGGSVVEPCNEEFEITFYRYRSSIDGGAWSAWSDMYNINDSIALGDLTGGTVDIQVVGADFAENWQFDADTAAEPDIAAFFATHAFQTYSWTVDITPPSASFVSGTLPASTTSSTVIDISVAKTGDVAYYKYKLAGPGQSDVWSEEKLAGTPAEDGENISITDLPEGDYTLKVIAGDCAGNWQAVADAETYNWTIDLSAPTALLGGVLPANPTKSDVFSVTVSGTDVVVYKWAIVNDTITCPTSIGSYSSDMDVADPITDNSGVDEGINTLCVVGGKDDGEGGYLYQGTSDSEVTKYTWNYDISAPTAGIASWITPSTEPDNVVVDEVRVLVGGTDVVTYKYVVNDTGICPDAATIGSESEHSVSQQIQAVGLDPGPVDICIIGRDTAGNWQGAVTEIHYNVIEASQPGDGDAGLDNAYVDNFTLSWANPSNDITEIRLQMCSDEDCNVPLSGFQNGVQLCSDATSCSAVTSYQYTGISNLKGSDYYARLRIKDQFGNQSSWGAVSDGKVICGGITGVVKDTSGVPVSGAVVELWTEGGSATGSQIGLDGTTDTDGSFTFNYSGGYDVPIAIAADGYVVEAKDDDLSPTITGSKSYIDVSPADDKDIGTVYIIATGGGDQFKISGSLVDATTGSLLSLANATISLYDWNGTLVSDAPDISGEIFSFDPTISGVIPGDSLPSGVYSIIAGKPGYYDLTEDQIVHNNAATDVGYLPMAEEFATGSRQIKVVLTWNDVAKDLDLHVVGEQTPGGDGIPNLVPNPSPTDRFHVYYLQRYCAEAGTYEPYGSTSLIMDDTDKYGPEIINLIDNYYVDGDYTFSVFNYDTTVADWNDVKAVIRIFSGEYFGTAGLISTITVPDTSGTDTTWKAVKINISGTNLIITPGASFLNLSKTDVEGTSNGTLPDPDTDPGLTNLDW